MVSNSLFESWYADGHWWLAGAKMPSRPPAGVLRYSSRSIELDLFGLPKDLFGRKLIKEDSWEPGDGPWIHGITTDGKLITLCQTCFGNESTNTISNLAARSKLVPRSIIVGAHLDENTLFETMMLRFPSVTEFCRLEPTFKIATKITKTRKIIKSQITTTDGFKEIIVPVTFRGESIEISFWRRPSIKPDLACHANVAVNAIAGIEITAKHGQRLDWWMSLNYSIKYLMSILYGQWTCSDGFWLQTKQDRVSIWYAYDRINIPSALNPGDILFPIAQIGTAALKRAVALWFSAPSEFEDTIYRFFSLFAYAHAKAKVNLVTASQTLEVFHQWFYPPVQLKKREAKLLSTLDSALALIKEKDPQLAQSIKDCLRFVRQPSQKDKLCALFIDIDKYAPRVFYEDPLDFLTCVVKTRNYYIHGTDAKKAQLSLVEQTGTVEGLKLAIFILVLKKLKLPAKVVQTRIRQMHSYKVWVWTKNGYLSPEALQNRFNSNKPVPKSTPKKKKKSKR